MIMPEEQRITSWVLHVIVAAILLQTLFFKFTAAEESVYIFTTLGMGPWGRIESGIAELTAAVLLLIPSTTAIGALLSLPVISGAIMSHLTKLGIVVHNEGGYCLCWRSWRLRPARLSSSFGARSCP